MYVLQNRVCTKAASSMPICDEFSVCIAFGIYIGYWLYFCFHRYYSVILQSVDNHPVFMNRYLNITHRLRNIIPIAAIISLMVTTILYSCTTDKRDLDRMDRSERQMENNPEMALAILDSIDHAKLHGRATKSTLRIAQKHSTRQKLHRHHRLYNPSTGHRLLSETWHPGPETAHILLSRLYIYESQ